MVITPTTCGGGANQIMSTSLVVAVIFSTGKNGAQAPCATCIDELANLDGNATFVSHPSPASGTTCGGAANQIMSQSLVVAIIYSTGKNGAAPPAASMKRPT